MNIKNAEIFAYLNLDNSTNFGGVLNIQWAQIWAIFEIDNRKGGRGHLKIKSAVFGDV